MSFQPATQKKHLSGMSHTKIHIPKPCHENWLEMTPEDQGRFCQSCQKTVFDFTKMPDRMIVQKINAEENVCGRFLSSQLDRELVVPKRKNSIWAAGFAGVLSVVNFASGKVYAQNIVPTVQTDQKTPRHVVGKPAAPNRETRIKMGETVAVAETEAIISGRVLEGDLPMIAVNIANKRTAATVQSDQYGNFQIAAKENDTLEFSMIGYNVEKVIISKSNVITVEMRPDHIAMGEAVVVAKKRNFFSRMFNRIANWFR